MSNNNMIRYEEGTIRSLIARPEDLVKVINQIDSSDFENINYKMIYEAMLDLLLEKANIDLPSIALKVSEKGGALDAGWFLDLAKNISPWIQKATPLQWAKLLKKEATRTKALNTLSEGLKEASEATSNPLLVMDKVSSQLTQIALETTAKEKFSIKDAISRFREETKELRETGGLTATINSAYPSLDVYTRGWAPTQLITVGARTGIGKSVFAINNIVAALQQEKSVCFFSLEMTEREVISRIASSLSMVSIQRIEKAEELSQEEEERVEEALRFIEQSKLTIEEDPRVTIESIKRKAIEQAQSDNGLDFIIIDYLQLIQNDGKKNRQEAVADVSRNMKILAKELNVPVMVLVQLNREKKDDEGDKTPKIYEIRESGAIAQDSNVVILIHRDLEADTEVIDPKALFIIAKNRQGEANRFINVRSRLECSLFVDDNPKAQEMLSHMQQLSDEEGKYEDVPTELTDYQKSLTNFDGEELTPDEVSELFGQDELDFSEDSLYFE